MLYMRSRCIFKNFRLYPTDPHDPYFAESFSVVNVILYPFQERTFSSIHALLIKHAFEKVIRPIIILKSFLQLSRIRLGVFLCPQVFQSLRIIPIHKFFPLDISLFEVEQSRISGECRYFCYTSKC